MAREAGTMVEDALAYATGFLKAHADGQVVHAGRPFRLRSEHIRRVCRWLERLQGQDGVEVACPQALWLAAAFHDVGYAYGKEDHGALGVDVMRAYAAARGIDAAVCERAAFLMREHSDKEAWLARADAPWDLVLLMEADLLDEEGAMGLVCDCLSAAAMCAPVTYEEVYARMRQFEPPRLAKNPMVTPRARGFWAEKQALIRDFLASYARDLGLEDMAE